MNKILTPEVIQEIENFYSSRSITEALLQIRVNNYYTTASFTIKRLLTMMDAQLSMYHADEYLNKFQIYLDEYSKRFVVHITTKVHSNNLDKQMNTDIFKCCSCPPQDSLLLRNNFIVIDVNSKLHKASYVQGIWRVQNEIYNEALNSWCYADEYYKAQLINLTKELQDQVDGLYISEHSITNMSNLKNLIDKYNALIKM